MNTAVIIVTYNSAATLPACLASVLAARQAGDELVVVDNASDDATPAILQKLVNTLPSDHIRLILNGVNLGFTAAVNQGVRSSRAPLIALLNPDTVVPEGWLHILSQHLAEPSIAAVGPVSNFAAGRQSVACHWQGKLPDGIGVTEAALKLYRTNKGLSESAKLLIGFCLLLRRTVVDEIGCLDERLFLGNDDLELSWRLRLNGYSLRIATDCFVYHVGQHSFRSEPATVMRRLLQESSDALYDILEQQYGSGRVPPPEEIWGIDWFEPSGAVFNQSVKFHQVLTLPRLLPESVPLTSIIILTWNQLAYTMECLSSLICNTSSPIEIIIVDNGSTDGTVPFLRNFASSNSCCVIIENSSNRGFAAGCNQGLELAKGEYLVLLNNDVVVTSGWLTGLIACHRSDPIAGIVGPLTNNASGVQGLGEQLYKGADELQTFAVQFHKRNLHRKIHSRRLVGFCMLFSKKLYYEIGGFDERFGSGNYEDDDFCLRSAIAGYRNLIAGDVYVHHYGSVTFNGAGMDYDQCLSGNYNVFREKWSAPVSDRSFEAKIVLCRLREELAKQLLDEQYTAVAQRICEQPNEIQQDSVVRELFALALWGSGDLSTAGFSILDSDSSLALTLRGFSMLGAGEMATAEDLFRKSVSREPGFGGAYLGLSNTAHHRGEYEYSCVLALKGLSLTPYFPIHEGLLPPHLLSGAPDPVYQTLADTGSLCPDSRQAARMLVVWSAKTGNFHKTVAAAEMFCRYFGIDDEVLKIGCEARKGLGSYRCRAESGQSITLCMIVKNEELYLARSLSSIRPLVHEIVVVDTGSSDHTKEIAELFGGKVFDIPWNSSFSDARNAGIQHATGDWIFVMDADETLSLRDYKLFSHVLSESSPCGWVLSTRNYTGISTMDDFQPLDGKYPQEEAGVGWTQSSKVRLFPNRPEIRFDGVIHETVDTSVVTAGLELRNHPVPVHHYGMLDECRRARKQKSYYELGRNKLLQRRDLKSIYEMAIQAAETGCFSEAEALWGEYIAENQDHAVAWFNLGYVLLQQKRVPEAFAATQHALSLKPEYPAAVANKGLCLFCLLEPSEALKQLLVLHQENPSDTMIGLLAAVAHCIANPHNVVLDLNQLFSANQSYIRFFDKLASTLDAVERYNDAAVLRESIR